MLGVGERLYWRGTAFSGGLRIRNNKLRGLLTTPDGSQCIGCGSDGIRVLSDDC